MKPRRLIVIGIILLLIGAVLPFLMVIKVVTATLFLSIFSYVASVSGLFIGFIGLANFVSDRERNNPQ